MMLLDANLLLYAYHPQAPEHERARTWFESALSGKGQVGLAWMTIWAFIRIATNPRAFEQPLATFEAVEIVGAWLAQPSAMIIEPGERYWDILQRLLVEGQVSGALVTDAALAALALEHAAILCTTDRDFSRFPGLRTLNPLIV